MNQHGWTGGDNNQMWFGVGEITSDPKKAARKVDGTLYLWLNLKIKEVNNSGYVFVGVNFYDKYAQIVLDNFIQGDIVCITGRLAYVRDKGKVNAKKKPRSHMKLYGKNITKIASSQPVKRKNMIWEAMDIEAKRVDDINLEIDMATEEIPW